MNIRTRRVAGSMPAYPIQARHVNDTRQILMGLALAATALAPHALLATGPEPVDLGSAGHFAILAGTAVSSTGGGAIRGDVGLSPNPGSDITGVSTAQVHGTIYAIDTSGPVGSVPAPALLNTAKVDLAAAYADAAGRSSGRIILAGDIGGQTLTNGLYGSASSLGITGPVTLDAQDASNAVWIFQIGSTLTTAAGGVGVPGSRVILTNGAQARNIYWQVGSSATLGTYSVFKGTLLAKTSITMNTGCTVDGRALASDGAVTFNGVRIGLPEPEAPRFTHIFRTNVNSATVVLSTTPYYLLTLKICSNLNLTNWATLVTDTPSATPWTYTDTTATADVTIRFYRAFLTF